MLEAPRCPWFGGASKKPRALQEASLAKSRGSLPGASTHALGHHALPGSLERSLVYARAAPAATLSVAIQVREDVTPFADSPTIDEVRDDPASESGTMALELIVSGHGANGTVRFRVRSLLARPVERCGARTWGRRAASAHETGSVV